MSDAVHRARFCRDKRKSDNVDSPAGGRLSEKTHGEKRSGWRDDLDAKRTLRSNDLSQKWESGVFTGC